MKRFIAAFYLLRFLALYLMLLFIMLFIGYSEVPGKITAVSFLLGLHGLSAPAGRHGLY